MDKNKTKNYEDFLLAVTGGEREDLLPLREKDLAEIDQSLTRFGEQWPVYAEILKRRFGLGEFEKHTYAKISQIKNFSLERAGQHTRKAPSLLRRFLYSEEYKKYFRSELEKSLEKLSEENAQLKTRMTEIECEVAGVLSETTTRCSQIFNSAPGLFPNANLNRKIIDLELSVRATNCLQFAGVKTVRDLVQKKEVEFCKIKNFGRKSLKEIKNILAEMGLYLGMRTP